jgi:hypothetical protein
VAADWQSIDSAPRDGTTVLLYSPDAAAPQVMLGFWSEWTIEELAEAGSEWADAWTGAAIDADPTHWSPVPDLPSLQLEAA